MTQDSLLLFQVWRWHKGLWVGDYLIQLCGEIITHTLKQVAILMQCHSCVFSYNTTLLLLEGHYYTWYGWLLLDLNFLPSKTPSHHCLLPGRPAVVTFYPLFKLRQLVKLDIHAGTFCDLWTPVSKKYWGNNHYIMLHFLKRELTANLISVPGKIVVWIIHDGWVFCFFLSHQPVHNTVGWHSQSIVFTMV